MCRAQRKLCKSSVSSTRTACGQWRATRQPNCSSDTKRSKITTSGCSSATNVSKLLQLSLTSTAFAQGERSAAWGERADALAKVMAQPRSEEHTSELQSRGHLVCRLLLEKKKTELPRHDTRQARLRSSW